MFLRTLAVAGIVLSAAVCHVEAESGKSDLQRYLKAEGEHKQKLKANLLKLPSTELQSAIAASRPAAPEASGVTEHETMCPDGFSRPFWLYVPEKYDAKKDYPLIVCLHGSCAMLSLRGSSGNPAPAEWALGYWKDNLPADWKSEVALLGCSAGIPQTNADAVWYFKGGEANVMHMIAEAKRLLSIDSNRVFVSGHSDGGNGSFGFAFRRPEAFAGYLPMCGNFTVPMMDNTPIWWENLKGQNIYAFNGKDDDLYPADELTPFYDLANSLGAKIEYKVYDKLTHDISPVVADEVHASLEKRIKTWRRDLTPKEIDWTCTSPERGRRAWLNIDAIRDLGELNAAPENAPLAGDRPRLGLQLADSEKPTVGSVIPGGAAESAGLKAGDVFAKFDDGSISTVQDLITALDKKRVGDEFKVTVTRDGKEVELTGSFPVADASWTSTDKARVLASFEPGRVKLKVSNAAVVSIYVFAEMLGKDGKLTVEVNGKVKDLGKIEPDNDFILSEFERTGDRDLPWLRRIELNCAELLNKG